MDVVTHFGLSQDPFHTPEPDSLAGGTLTPEAARAYLAGRIAGAGGPDLFSRSALDILAEAAKGDPDRLRRLGGSALFHAAFEGARRVEDQHARQAAVTQERWVQLQDPVRTAPATAPVHTLGADTPAAAAVLSDPVAAHRRWWRRTPPITRLAIVVGLLLLSLPVIGYIIGAVKDSQASGSSYLPEDSIVDAEKIAPAETDAPGTVSLEAAAGTASNLRAPTPARPPVELRPPAATTPMAAPLPEPEPEPVLDATTEAEPEPEPLPGTEPVPAEEPAAPPPQLETVPIDPPAVPVVEAQAPTPQA
jgi:hypothetical protein